jgi:hypothetical protein
VSHSVEPDWFGKPLTPPAHSVPGVVQEIVCQQKQWHASIGGNQLFCKAFDISAKNVPALVSALLSKDRTIPLIVVSNAEATGEPLVVPNELAKSVAGMASVLRIKDVDAKKVFDASMPDRFRVFNGAIRIYQPGLDFERYLDSYRHRYFTEADIVDFGMSVVGSAVVKSSLRQERGGTQDAVSSLEDVRFREFTTKLVANSENSALVEPLFAEIDNQRKKYDDLFEDYQKLYGQWESSVAAKEGLESDLREQERTIGALSFRLRQTKAESNSTEKATPSFVDSVLAATGGTKIVCVRSKQDGSYLRAVQTIFSLTEADSNRLFEEVEAEHSSNQVQSLIKAYAGRIVVYAWGHLKSMDADETKGFREFFEGQSTSRALQWLVQWVNSVTNS